MTIEIHSTCVQRSSLRPLASHVRLDDQGPPGESPGTGSPPADVPQRFRPLESPLVRLYSDLLALLASNSAAAPPIRDAFHAALSNSDQKSLQASSLDIQLRQLFNDPPRLVVVQGSAITAAQIDNAWTSPLPAKTAQGTVHVSDCIFVNYALHTELVRTKDEGEAEEEANLSSTSLDKFLNSRDR